MVVNADKTLGTTPDTLRTFFVLLYLAVFLMLAMFWPFAAAETIAVKLYIGLTTAAYAALYVLLPFLLTLAVGQLAGIRDADFGWRRTLVYFTAWLGAALVLLALYADYRLYELYEYHFNGFVWNLLTTPGGIAALGATDATVRTIAAQVAALLLGTAAVLWWLQRSTGIRQPVSRRTMQIAIGILMATLLSGDGIYAYSTYTGKEEYVHAAEAVPFPLHIGLAGVFKRLGLQKTALATLRIAGGEVNYPSRDLPAVPLKSYPNILMLVGESFRWDLLDPEITPNLWRLAGKSLRFDHHYSGGSRTRMGLFSMFYGLYSPYWYSFERQRVPPALMEFVRGKNYQLALHTSQSFDYPELRHTLFTGIPEEFMQELKSGEPWKRDHNNISDIITKLEQRDRQRPFFGFMFFESTHAPYTFPETAVIRPDYTKELNYLRMDLQDGRARIHARYVNAAHHVDAEAGRLLDYLESNGMLDNTIVLFTGDHGEEFMEKGHWGHGHARSFPEEQIRVPLVLHLPGQSPEVFTHRSSHLQIAPTLLKKMGVTGDTHAYSSAGDLFSSPPYFVVGDYNYMGIFDSADKVIFPFTGSDYFRYTVHDTDDRPVTREARKQAIEVWRPRIEEVVAESRRFLR